MAITIFLGIKHQVTSLLVPSSLYCDVILRPMHVKKVLNISLQAHLFLFYIGKVSVRVEHCTGTPPEVVAVSVPTLPER